MMIDASQRRTASLADNPDYNLMATALADMGAYSVFLSDEVLRLDDETLIGLLFDHPIELYDKKLIEEVREAIVAAAAGELLSVFRTYAIGIGQDDESPFMTLVYIYETPQQASSNVDVFKQQIENGGSLWMNKRWQDVVDDMEVWADGRSLRAKLYGDIVSMWIDIVYLHDTLIWCGE